MSIKILLNGEFLRQDPAEVPTSCQIFHTLYLKIKLLKYVFSFKNIWYIHIDQINCMQQNLSIHSLIKKETTITIKKQFVTSTLTKVVRWRYLCYTNSALISASSASILFTSLFKLVSISYIIPSSVSARSVFIVISSSSILSCSQGYKCFIQKLYPLPPSSGGLILYSRSK